MYQWFTAGFEDLFLVKLWNMSITAGIAILAVTAVRVLLRRAPKIFSYALWGIVLFRLLCPISFSSRFSAFSLLEYVAQSQAAVQTHADTEALAVSGEDQTAVELMVNPGNPAFAAPAQDPDLAIHDKEIENGIGNETERETAGVEVQAPAPERARSWESVIPFLYGVWGAGAAVLLSVNLVTLRRLKRRTAVSRKLRDNVFLCDQVDTPFCLGVFGPKIYLPSTLGEREREYILLHEMHHIRRCDHIVKLLAFLALCLHWFNPLVWLAFFLAGKDMEMSCDEAVMKQMEGDIRKEYSLSLLQLATGKRAFVSAGLSFGEGNPRQRIQNIMNYKRPGFWVVMTAVAGCLVTATVLMTDPQEKPGEADSTVVSSEEHEAQTSEEAGSTAVSSEEQAVGEPSGAEGGEASTEAPSEGGESDGQQTNGSAGEYRQERLAAYYELIRKAEEAIYDPKSNGENYEAYLDDEGNALFSSEVTWLYDGRSDIAYQNIGYLIQDINGDGVEELLFGENAPLPGDGWNGIIYDLYTYSNHRLVHVFQGWNRSRYHLTEEGVIARAWESSAFEGGTEFYEYDGTRLTLLEKLDSRTDSNAQDAKREILHTIAGDSKVISETEEQKILDKYHYESPVFHPIGPFWAGVGDLGGDARGDYVIYTGRDGIYNHLALYLTGEGIVYEHEDPLAVDLGSLVCRVDLDHDGEDEILLTMCPHVNSMPLTEYAVLKKADGVWKKLEMYHEEGNILANSFPLKLVRGTGKWEVKLSCEGLDKTIAIDLQPDYIHWKELAEQTEDSFAQTNRMYYENEFSHTKPGEDVGGISDWGIWEIRVSSFDGQPCLAATQGIQGYDKHIPWGQAAIFFDYDRNGKIRVLDIVFEPESNAAEAGGWEEAGYTATIRTNASLPVTLAASQVYDDGLGHQISICCDVYYPIDGERMKIGQVLSGGTAYPVAYDEKGIYAAAGHELVRYVVDETLGVLRAAERLCEKFDENGNAVYTHQVDDEIWVITQEEYQAEYRKYPANQVVVFSNN